jgi:hypothetical protein
MIYQDKTAALEQDRRSADLYAQPRRPAATEPNHRMVRSKAATGPRSPSMLDKVKNFNSATRLRAAGLYPYFRVISSAQDTEVDIDGTKVLRGGANSYLGLTNHPKIKEATRRQWTNTGPVARVPGS